MLTFFLFESLQNKGDIFQREIMDLDFSLKIFVKKLEKTVFQVNFSHQAKPTITQPSRNEAGKVMVNWGSIIKNPK